MKPKLLKLARYFSGMTSEQMAGQLNIHRTVYSRYENGLRNIPPKHVKKIQEILAENGIGIAELEFLQGVIANKK